MCLSSFTGIPRTFTLSISGPGFFPGVFVVSLPFWSVHKRAFSLSWFTLVRGILHFFFFSIVIPFFSPRIAGYVVDRATVFCRRSRPRPTETRFVLSFSFFICLFSVSFPGFQTATVFVPCSRLGCLRSLSNSSFPIVFPLVSSRLSTCPLFLAVQFGWFFYRPFPWLAKTGAIFFCFFFSWVVFHFEVLPGPCPVFFQCPFFVGTSCAP